MVHLSGYDHKGEGSTRGMRQLDFLVRRSVKHGCVGKWCCFLNGYDIAIIGHGVPSNDDAWRLALFGFFQRYRPALLGCGWIDWRRGARRSTGSRARRLGRSEWGGSGRLYD